VKIFWAPFENLVLPLPAPGIRVLNLLKCSYK
jgi:hypothetical protein